MGLELSSVGRAIDFEKTRRQQEQKEALNRIREEQRNELDPKTITDRVWRIPGKQPEFHPEYYSDKARKRMDRTGEVSYPRLKAAISQFPAGDRLQIKQNLDEIDHKRQMPNLLGSCVATAGGVGTLLCLAIFCAGLVQIVNPVAFGAAGLAWEFFSSVWMPLCFVGSLLTAVAGAVLLSSREGVNHMFKALSEKIEKIPVPGTRVNKAVENLQAGRITGS
jgi:hypothetical protein